MLSKLLVVLVAVLLGGGLLVWSLAKSARHASDAPFPKGADEIPITEASMKADAAGADAQTQQALASGSNAFAFKLYKQLRGAEGNVFFCPYSITAALAMTYEGAAGQTASEIGSVFGLPSAAAQRRPAFAALHNALNPQGAKYQLTTANALWIQQDFPVLKDYSDAVERYYAGKAANLDFEHDAEGARMKINDWVATGTNDKIKELFPPQSILPDTRLVLTNTIYFKGRWASQFDPEQTSDMPFRAPGGPVTTKMMALRDSDEPWPYFEDDAMQALELPYEGEQLSMLLLLPKADDLSGLEAQLSSEMLSSLESKLQPNTLDLYLPRFSFRQKSELSDSLALLGMPTAFSDAADFSGITGGKDLLISAVLHQAVIEVNEEGTEAAAATGVTMAPTGMRMDKLVFRADHSFVFLIRDKQSGLILFMGRVENPAG